MTTDQSTHPLRNQITAFLAEHGMKAATFAKRAGKSGAALSQYLSGNYGADPAALEAAFRAVLDGANKANRLAPPAFFATPLSEQVHEALDFARHSGTARVITGPAGQGKTRALEAYRAEFPTVILVRVTVESAGPTGVRAAIWQALGSPAGKKQWDAIVEKLKDSGRLIILDDAHQLTAKGFAWCMGLMDATGIGLVFCGNADIARRHVASAEQWASRVSAVDDVDWPTEPAEARRQFTTAAANLARHYLDGHAGAAAAIRAAAELATKSRSLRRVEQALRVVRWLLGKGITAPDAFAAACSRMRLTFDLRTLAAPTPAAVAALPPTSAE